MTRILTYRFSAFGDVAMIAPVFREALEQNPNLEIVLVSRITFEDLFHGIPNLIFKGIDLEDYKGLIGMEKLARDLKKEFEPDMIGDFHDVIRSKILNKIFKRKGLSVFVLDKGKDEKEQLTDIWNLNKIPLKHTTERYADVLRKMGFQLILSHQYRKTNREKSGIGFAPFAQHHGKMLPLEKSFELVKILAEHYKIYFFGGGKDEIELLNSWVAQIPNTENLAGKLDLKGELEQISKLELMISMDSANMHLASLMGTRCVSIWGSTHPFAGFLGYGQNINDVIQVKDLTCRPCSIFGDKACYRGDWACLEELKIQQVLDKIITL